VTYAVGKVAQERVKSGMSDDVRHFGQAWDKEKEFAEEKLDDLKQHCNKEHPLGDEKRKFDI